MTIQPLQNVKEIEIRFQSSKNRDISTFTDVSKNTPNFSVSRHPNKGKDIWFPVVDLELGDGIKAVVEFDNLRSGMRYCFLSKSKSYLLEEKYMVVITFFIV